MKINQQEIIALSNLKPEERYSYFIKKLADFEIFYTLKNENGDFVLSEVDENKLFPIWNAPEFAQLCLLDVWEKHTVVEITLDEFEETIIDFIEENSILINVFPVGKRIGFVVDLDELVRDLNIEFGKY